MITADLTQIRIMSNPYQPQNFVGKQCLSIYIFIITKYIKVDRN